MSDARLTFTKRAQIDLRSTSDLYYMHLQFSHKQKNMGRVQVSFLYHPPMVAHSHRSVSTT